MDRVITQISKSDIADIIKQGLPEDSEIFYFNPDIKLGSSNYIRLYPVTTATLANAMDDSACFIKIVTRNTDDDESSFDDGSDNEVTFRNYVDDYL